MTKLYQSGGKDSLVKVVDVYLAAVTKEPFTFNGKRYEPKELRISPAVLRDFKCLANCGACCRDFTLDWLPNEKMPYKVEKRTVEVNGKEYEICTDLNTENIKDKFGKVRCKNLNQENGRCMIHMSHPFSCDFELLRFKSFENYNMLGHQLFGRGWNMKRVSDGEKGALCEMQEKNEAGRKETIRKLNRLKDWTDYFQLESNVPKIISWVSTIPFNYTKQLIIPVGQESLETVM